MYSLVHFTSRSFGMEADKMVEKLLLSVKESGEATGLSPWSIRKYIAEGKIMPTRIGRRVLIEPAELQRLIDKGRQVSKLK